MCGPPVLWDSAVTRPHRDAQLWRAQRWAQQRDALGGGRAGSEALGPAGPRAQQRVWSWEGRPTWAGNGGLSWRARPLGGLLWQDGCCRGLEVILSQGTGSPPRQ